MTKNQKIFLNELRECLTLSDKAKQWQDLVLFLQRTKKVFMSYSNSATLSVLEEDKLYERTQLVTRQLLKKLPTCLDSQMPSSVKQTALEVYEEIFEMIDEQVFIENISIIANPLFSISATIPLRLQTNLVKLFYLGFLKFPYSLLVCLDGFVSSLLNFLQDKKSEAFDKTLELLNTTNEIIQDKSALVNSVVNTMIANLDVRMGGLNFLTSFIQWPQPEEFSNEQFMKIYLGNDIDAFFTALKKSLDTENGLFSKRLCLDLLLYKFSLTNTLFTDKIKFELIKSCLLLLLENEQTLNRRVFEWIFNEIDEKRYLILETAFKHVFIEKVEIGNFEEATDLHKLLLVRKELKQFNFASNTFLTVLEPIVTKILSDGKENSPKVNNENLDLIKTHINSLKLSTVFQTVYELIEKHFLTIENQEIEVETYKQIIEEVDQIMFLLPLPVEEDKTEIELIKNTFSHVFSLYKQILYLARKNLFFSTFIFKTSKKFYKNFSLNLSLSTVECFFLELLAFIESVKSDYKANFVLFSEKDPVNSKKLKYLIQKGFSFLIKLINEQEFKNNIIYVEKTFALHNKLRLFIDIKTFLKNTEILLKFFFVNTDEAKMLVCFRKIIPVLIKIQSGYNNEEQKFLLMKTVTSLFQLKSHLFSSELLSLLKYKEKKFSNEKNNSKCNRDFINLFSFYLELVITMDQKQIESDEKLDAFFLRLLDSGFTKYNKLFIEYFNKKVKTKLECPRLNTILFGPCLRLLLMILNNNDISEIRTGLLYLNGLLKLLNSEILSYLIKDEVYDENIIKLYQQFKNKVEYEEVDTRHRFSTQGKSTDSISERKLLTTKTKIYSISTEVLHKTFEIEEKMDQPNISLQIFKYLFEIEPNLKDKLSFIRNNLNFLEMAILRTKENNNQFLFLEVLFTFKKQIIFYLTKTEKTDENFKKTFFLFEHLYKTFYKTKKDFHLFKSLVSSMLEIFKQENLDGTAYWLDKFLFSLSKLIFIFSKEQTFCKREELKNSTKFTIKTILQMYVFFGKKRTKSISVSESKPTFLDTLFGKKQSDPFKTPDFRNDCIFYLKKNVEIVSESLLSIIILKLQRKEENYVSNVVKPVFLETRNEIRIQQKVVLNNNLKFYYKNLINVFCDKFLEEIFLFLFRKIREFKLKADYYPVTNKSKAATINDLILYVHETKLNAIIYFISLLKKENCTNLLKSAFVKIKTNYWNFETDDDNNSYDTISFVFLIAYFCIAAGSHKIDHDILLGDFLEVLKERKQTFNLYEASWLLTISQNFVFTIKPDEKYILQPLVHFMIQILAKLKDNINVDCLASLSSLKEQNIDKENKPIFLPFILVENNFSSMLQIFKKVDKFVNNNYIETLPRINTASNRFFSSRSEAFRRFLRNESEFSTSEKKTICEFRFFFFLEKELVVPFLFMCYFNCLLPILLKSFLNNTEKKFLHLETFINICFEFLMQEKIFFFNEIQILRVLNLILDAKENFPMVEFIKKKLSDYYNKPRFFKKPIAVLKMSRFLVNMIYSSIKEKVNLLVNRVQFLATKNTQSESLTHILKLTSYILLSCEPSVFLNYANFLITSCLLVLKGEQFETHAKHVLVLLSVLSFKLGNNLPIEGIRSVILRLEEILVSKLRVENPIHPPYFKNIFEFLEIFCFKSKKIAISLDWILFNTKKENISGYLKLVRDTDSDIEEEISIFMPIVNKICVKCFRKFTPNEKKIILDTIEKNYTNGFIFLEKANPVSVLDFVKRIIEFLLKMEYLRKNESVYVDEQLEDILLSSLNN